MLIIYILKVTRGWWRILVINMGGVILLSILQHEIIVAHLWRDHDFGFVDHLVLTVRLQSVRQKVAACRRIAHRSVA